MATVAPTSDQAAGLLQKLSLDSQPNTTLEAPEPTKKTSIYQYGAVESGVSANGQAQPSERSVTPFLPDPMDPAMFYLPNAYSPAYYYGYNGTGNEWPDEYPRYGTTDGVEMPTGVYGDNGSVMYNGYGYAPYGPYSPATSPVPTLGNDGQLYGPQQYQYPSYFPSLTPTGGQITPTLSVTSQGELSTSTTVDQTPLPVESAKGNSSGIVNSGGLKGNSGSTPYKPTYQNTSLNSSNIYGRGTLPGSIPISGYQDGRYNYGGQYRGSGIGSSFSKANNAPSSRNQNFRQNSNFMSLNHHGPLSGMPSSQGFMNRMYPDKYYDHYGSTYGSGMAYGSSGYGSRINENGWMSVDNKYKQRGRGNSYLGYRNENADGLNEMNRGPRAKPFKNQKVFTPINLVSKGQNVPSGEPTSEEKDDLSNVPDREQYNRADFLEEYNDAKFFIIKSYSEDDVHKSIKYNVWASTPNGNKKLDAAYQEAHQKSVACPVFLFFSVNTSGQFVGLAEMVGPVDFEKNVEYWQQDKWTGSFPVKWHIVKDVPNNSLKHITLENNENKPVTNSRDTQEVKLEQGLRMIKIFKDYSSKTCILDDFIFYENRQKKIIQEKKAKQQQFQKQELEKKPDKEKKEVANGSDKGVDVGSDVIKEPALTAQANGDVKHSDNGSSAKTDDASKASKQVASEKKIVSNGIANGC